MQIVVFDIVDRSVGSSSLLRRRIDQGDFAPVRDPFWRDVIPVLASIARAPNQSVIGSGPDNALLHGRFGHCVNEVVILGAGLLFGHGAAGRTLLGLVVAAQVRADYCPTLSAVR